MSGGAAVDPDDVLPTAVLISLRWMLGDLHEALEPLEQLEGHHIGHSPCAGVRGHEPCHVRLTLDLVHGLLAARGERR